MTANIDTCIQYYIEKYDPQSKHHSKTCHDIHYVVDKIKILVLEQVDTWEADMFERRYPPKIDSFDSFTDTIMRDRWALPLCGDVIPSKDCDIFFASVCHALAKDYKDTDYLVELERKRDIYLYWNHDYFEEEEEGEGEGEEDTDTKA